MGFNRQRTLMAGLDGAVTGTGCRWIDGFVDGFSGLDGVDLGKNNFRDFVISPSLYNRIQTVKLYNSVDVGRLRTVGYGSARVRKSTTVLRMVTGAIALRRFRLTVRPLLRAFSNGRRIIQRPANGLFAEISTISRRLGTFTNLQQVSSWRRGTGPLGS